MRLEDPEQMLSGTQSKSAITCLMTQSGCPAMRGVMDASAQHLQCGFQTMPLPQRVFKWAQQSKGFSQAIQNGSEDC